MAEDSGYLICNDDNDLLRIDGISILGETVSIWAIFHTKEEAERVLKALRLHGDIKNTVKRLGPHFRGVENA